MSIDVLNETEFALLCGNNHDPVEQLMRNWAARHGQTVVVTLGAEGVRAATPDAFFSAPALPVNPVDTVGAGDAFSAGLLAGLDDAGLLDRDALRTADEAALRTALVLAGEVAGITCGRAGADPPTRAEVGTSGGAS